MKKYKSILNERIKESQVRNYFNYMASVYGEDVAVATAMETDSIKDSIGLYSSSLNGITDGDVYKALLRAHVVFAPEESENDKLISYLIATGKIDELQKCLQSNRDLKESLVRNYVQNANTKLKDAYNRKTGAEETANNVLGDLYTIEYHFDKQSKAIKSAMTKVKEKTSA